MPTELPKRRQPMPRRQPLVAVLIKVFLAKLMRAWELFTAKRRRPRK
jgi:hypothetical protein